MAEFEVDPDGLTAAGSLAQRQGQHLSTTSGYIDSVCGRTGAFSGVLTIFKGSYEETLQHARQGMTDSQHVAAKVQQSFDGCSADYVRSDHSSYQVFRKTFGDEVDLPPYRAPGGGDTSVGGPLSKPTAGGPTVDPENFELPEVPEAVDKPLERVLGSDGGHEPPSWMSPTDAARDSIVRNIHTRQDYDAYVAYRHDHPDATAEQALSAVRPDVDTRADTHVHHQIDARAEDAYNNAYDHARQQGMSDADARDAGNDAAGEQRAGDHVDHQNRRDIGSTASTYMGAYDQVNQAVGTVQDIQDQTEQLDQTTDDLDDYNDFEHQPDDTSAQDWGNK